MMHRKLLAITLVGTHCGLVDASYEKIAGYMPGSQVTDHNAIDLDQAALETALALTPVDYAGATTIYSSGYGSKNYAQLTVPALTVDMSKGMKAMGTGMDGSSSEGKVYSSAATGATTLKVGYSTSDVQATHVKCMEDAGITGGCFNITAGITITAASTVTVYPTAIAHKNGRTLKGFSTGASSKMYSGCAGCPYFDFMHYYDYYGDTDYADKFVSAALAGTAVGFTKPEGEMTFVGADDDTRVQCAKKGTAYMNAYMYVIREYEDAIDDCNAGCVGGLTDASCNSASLGAVHAWDEGVAFYTGSREGVDGSGSGKLMYALADKRCSNFKTCAGSDGLTAGISAVSTVNEKMFADIAIGQHKLLMGKCEEVRPYVRSIVAQMAVPLIQGTLRYAYKVDKLAGGSKEKAEGAVFAAAVVPRVAYCSAADAKIIMDNMKLGAASTGFAAVKTAFENNYKCMNITCTDVGGLWFGANNDYYEGAEPCTFLTSEKKTASTEEKIPVWAIGALGLLGLLVVLFLFSCLCIIQKERKSGKPVFFVTAKGGGPEGGAVAA